MSEQSKQGLFVGLTTLDLIYQVPQVPQANQKLVAQASLIAAGGPATNAAIAFQALGNTACLVSRLGLHALAALLKQDLQQWQIQLLDLMPQSAQMPPVSSILVTAATGDRAVISRNAVSLQVEARHLLPLPSADIVLIDGHQMAVSQAIAQQAQRQQIPVVIDGGSWKPGFERVLPYATYVICSENFRPPDCHTTTDVVAYLRELGLAKVAITHGDRPIEFWQDSTQGSLAVPSVSVVDTLGAGDIFHGAFCHWILQPQISFSQALKQAAQVAAFCCQFWGTREGLIRLQQTGGQSLKFE
ncbi:PfkB family carbohydrate kinase [Almyronema epifaneia]|uniref:PfkB family carbohydrate kinase n=1 Tax=Almyronema epifaneia S1 TaxID=2991925 RepID=A0ABW6IGV3_9CYAN